ncbi:SDR family NAD(P)-dependent oxidoreductase [Komagataeibacter rhaeticus]|nr:SDR family NAD(P)-dependent oxidoreductase [Komagataeibacter rhaeticus]
MALPAVGPPSCWRAATRKGHGGADAASGRRAGAKASFRLLDVASLSAIATFAHELAQETDRLDVLVNNAGVMGTPRRLETRDGFELQFGTNFLGPFALTARLRPLLCAAPQGAGGHGGKPCRAGWPYRVR